jgi:phage replication initiation protein
LDLFGGPDLEWSDSERGSRGYKNGKIRGNVRVWFDGGTGMGVHVDVSGSGCRQLEGEKVVSDWRQFFGKLIDEGAKFCRVDAAIDERAGLLSLEVMEKHLRAEEYVSRSRAWMILESGEKGSAATGKTINFGKRVSGMCVRAYNKSAQQGLPGHWIRVELEAKDERAQGLVKVVIGSGANGVAGVLRGFLDFKDVGANQQKTRWATAPWWLEFVASAAKVRIALEPKERSVQRVICWLQDQIAPSLAVIALAQGAGVGVLADIIDQGLSRLRPRHLSLLGLGSSGFSTALSTA